MNRFLQLSLASLFGLGGLLFVWVGPQLPQAKWFCFVLGAICFVIAIITAVYKDKPLPTHGRATEDDLRSMSWWGRKQYELGTFDVARLTFWG